MTKFFQVCLLALCALGGLQSAQAENILVNEENFTNVWKDAKPGDVFTIFPGTYTIKKAIQLKASGTKLEPIVMQPSTPGSVTILVGSTVGFKVLGANWTIQDLQMLGTCVQEQHCHHAFHVVGNADNLILRRNVLVDFNSTLKSNGEMVRGVQLFPDNVLIEGNYIFNRWPRNTGAPVTLLDVVGGNHWIIRDNFIADFQKYAGNQISYAAFLKGNSENGLFERNLVVCEWKHQGGTRLGLSLGGGGTGQKYCKGGDCRMEHYKGTLRGNVILNCPQDVGVYLNKAANTRIIGNTIVNTVGVDVRYGTSFATIANNVIEGRINDRDGGRHHDISNIVGDDVDDLLPRRKAYDLRPADLGDLRSADSDYMSVDFCTGEAQNTWVGAFSEPRSCTIKDKLAEAESKLLMLPEPPAP